MHNATSLSFFQQIAQDNVSFTDKENTRLQPQGKRKEKKPVWLD
jgi:hypothetical protein